MAARLWTALLLLSAVFAMHGLQCTSAADGVGHAATPAGHAADAFSLAMTAVVPGHVPAATTAGIDHTDPIAAAPVAGHADSAPAVPHDAPAHLWTVCLAVLAAALAVLLAVLVPRLTQLAAPALASARSRLRSVAPPRPPDLSALCLLRI